MILTRVRKCFPWSAFYPAFALFFLALLLSPPATSAFTTEEEVNISVYERFGPAVVNITSTTVDQEFFYNAIPQTGSGSGVIIDIKGNILTNYHVVEDARRLEVTLFDGTKYEARMVGVDPGNDLAIIRIDASASRLTPIPFGDSSDLKVGQKVLAIGNPFGLERTLTTGIVSSLGRTIKAVNGRLIRGIIQTDAAINPGNSGGPMLDSEGRMIGLNSALFSPVGANVGIGFAIPVNRVKRSVAQLLEKGYVSTPWLGISAQDITQELAWALELSSVGVLVSEVFAESPAHKAGLRGGSSFVRLGNMLIAVGGDFITSVDGKTVKDMEDLSDHMEGYEIGQVVKIGIVRDGHVMTLDLALEEMPRN